MLSTFSSKTKLGSSTRIEAISPPATLGPSMRCSLCP
jgi:hypothetical protein